MKKWPFGRKKTLWITIFLVFILLMIFTSIAQASWGSDDKEVKDFLIKYQDHLHYTKGGIGSVVGQMFLWSIIRGAYWVCRTIQGLVPEALSVFGFVESSGISQIYTSVVNTIVVSLMIISLIIIGFKMVTQKGAIDLKSLGMNIIISVILILLMPTMITSGIKFAKIFYNDSINITTSEGGVAWKMIEDGVTDLVYINKQNRYNNLGQSGQKKNALKEKDFFVYDLCEIITPDTAKDLEDDNRNAKFLQYKLTPDGDGNMVPVKIDSNWMSLFSDSFKGGYYRYSKDTFSLVVGLISLAIAYVFSAFIIMTSIIELSIKRVLSVLVFATDLESGQKSKMVLSDIMQCFLIIGFQGFNMSIFAMFITFMGSGGGASVNPFIKAISYISAVFVLIKGSDTIMRYFGIDIGVKEGFAQMTTALGMSAMMLRSGKNAIKGKGGKGNPNREDGNNEGEDKQQPQKNFGNSIKGYVNKVGHGVGYGRERGFGGLTHDAINSVTDKATKPIRSIRDGVKNTKQGFIDGIDDGTVNAIKKGMDLNKNKETPENNLKNSINNTSENDRLKRKHPIDPSMEYKIPGSNGNIPVQQQIEQIIRQRKAQANESEMNKGKEEFISQKYQKPNYNPESIPMSQLINSKEKIQSNSENPSRRKERILNTKENIQPGNSPSTTQREQILNTKENIRSNSSKIATGSQTEKIVNVKENIQPGNSPSTIQKEQIINTRENIHPSSEGRTSYKEQIVNERVNESSNNQKNYVRNVDIVEDVKSTKSNYNNKPNNSDKQNVIVKENVTVKEHLENKKKFNLKGNSLFEDNSNNKNSLFDF